jgi:SAM-dependent methyltransferase
MVVQVSIDYLVYPVAVTREINRVLKPGGLAAFSFSNRCARNTGPLTCEKLSLTMLILAQPLWSRCFPTKVIQIWTQLPDRDKVRIHAGLRILNYNSNAY